MFNQKTPPYHINPRNIGKHYINSQNIAFKRTKNHKTEQQTNGSNNLNFPFRKKLHNHRKKNVIEKDSNLKKGLKTPLKKTTILSIIQTAKKNLKIQNLGMKEHIKPRKKKP